MWHISERLPGRTLHQVWNELTPSDQREVVTSLGVAIRALHQVEVPIDFRPPWLRDALIFEPREGYHAPIEAGQVDQAALLPGADVELIKRAQSWMSERLDLFVGDTRVLVHADLHPSNVMVDGTEISGLIDFEMARAQPADAELHRLLFGCARIPGRPAGAGRARTRRTDSARRSGLAARCVPTALRCGEPARAPSRVRDSVGTRAAAPHADPRLDGRDPGPNPYSAQRPRADRRTALVSPRSRRRPDRRTGASRRSPLARNERRIHTEHALDNATRTPRRCAHIGA